MNSLTMTLIAIGVFMCVVGGVGGGVFYERVRRRKDTSDAFSRDLSARIDALHCEIELYSRMVQEHGQRLLHLERRPAPAPAAPAAAQNVSYADEVAPLRTSGVAERRRRVLALSRRGQDAATIAATLGMSRAESELIIKLAKQKNVGMDAEESAFS
jgi:hypothetical protein